MVSRRQVIGGLAAGLVLPGTVARAQTGRVITTHISVEDNRVWIAATINGSRPYLFIIDTGCVVSLIEERVARELALRARGQVRLAGVGGSDIFALYEARDVAFSSGLRQPSVVFGAVARELALGRGAAGAFAAGLLTGADSDLDLDRGEWRLYPDGRGSWDGYSAIPSSIAHDDGAGGSAFVYVDAVLNGRTFRLLVDTGAPGQVSLWPNAVRRSGLWNDTAPYLPVRPTGIGRHIDRARVVRANTLALGDIAFDRPQVMLRESAPLQLPAAGDGIIGLALLQQMTLSTDVRGRRLWVQRNGRAAPAERYRMTGLWVDDHGGQVVVAEVSPASPAAEAGVRVGDVIEGVSLDGFLRAAGGPPGTRVPIRLRRGGETIATTLVLRAYL